MRWLLVLMMTAGVARANGDGTAVVGLGTAMSRETTGWALRVIGRMDDAHDDVEAQLVSGSLVGFEVWSAGDRWGMSFPCGAYVGAHVGSVRTTVGGGLGMFATEKRDNESEGSGGIAPFASATVEKLAGDLVIALEGTIARQIIIDRTDHNVYTVMLMAGRRIGK